MDGLNALIGQKKNKRIRSIIRGAVSVGAAVAMYFAPDHIDSIIESALALFGVEQLTEKDG